MASYLNVRLSNNYFFIQWGEFSLSMRYPIVVETLLIHYETTDGWGYCSCMFDALQLAR